MELALVRLVLLVVAIVLAVIAYRRRQDLGRDDLVRLDDEKAHGAAAKALRGGDKSAWMRPSNFGG